MKIDEHSLNYCDIDLVKELVDKLDILPEREPGYGVTARELAVYSSVSEKTAKNRLDDAEKAGILKVERMRFNGKKTFVYTEPN